MNWFSITKGQSSVWSFVDSIQWVKLNNKFLNINKTKHLKTYIYIVSKTNTKYLNVYKNKIFNTNVSTKKLKI